MNDSSIGLIWAGMVGVQGYFPKMMYFDINEKPGVAYKINPGKKIRVSIPDKKLLKNSESELESRSVISFVGRNTDGITISIESDVNSRIHVYVQKTNQKVICTWRNRQNRR